MLALAFGIAAGAGLVTSASAFTFVPRAAPCNAASVVRLSLNDCSHRTCSTCNNVVHIGGNPLGRPQHHHRQRHFVVFQGRQECTVMVAEQPPGGGKFIKMGGEDDTHTFGPRCILASGLSFDDRSALRSILDEDDQEQHSVGGTPLVVSTPEIADKRVGDVLTDAPMISLLQEKQMGTGISSAGDEPPSPVILISGFTNLELRKTVARFRSETGLRAAFAKAVPNAMTKSVVKLCEEIAQDHADALAGKLHGGKHE